MTPRTRSAPKWLPQALSRGPEPAQTKPGKRLLVGARPQSLESASRPTSSHTISAPPSAVVSDKQGVAAEPQQWNCVEAADLYVPGETIFADDDDDDEDDSVPVRLLTEFEIFRSETLQLIDIDTLLDGTDGFTASGIVKRWVEDDNSDSDSDDGSSDEEGLDTDIRQRVKLSTILQFDHHWVSDQRPDMFQLDPKMYLRTSFAWYILDIPSSRYASFFQNFWIEHRLLHIIVESSVEDPEVTYDDFERSLNTPERSAPAKHMIGRPLDSQDVRAKAVGMYVLTTLNAICVEFRALRRLFGSVPLIQQFCQMHGGTSTFDALGSGVKKNPQPKNVEKVTSQHHQNATVVTCKVRAIACNLFSQPLRVVGPPEDDSFPRREKSRHAHIHSDDPISIEWVQSSRIAPHHYRSVLIDGIRYDEGDAVIVEKGADSNAVRESNAASQAAQSSNDLANSKWFGVIQYMYEKDDDIMHSRSRSERSFQKMCHVQWLQHGSQILLQESAHPQGLFWLNECDDLPLESIYQKCDLHVLDAVQNEPPECQLQGNEFFVSMTWDEHDASFIEVSEDTRAAARRACKPWRQCVPCGIHALDKESITWTPLPGGGLTQRGVEYHVHDVVYLRPTDDTDIYTIAQITDITTDRWKKQHTINVRLLERYDTAVYGNTSCTYGLQTDERRLFLTEKTHSAVDVSRIDGKAFVLHPSVVPADQRGKWIQIDDHYFADLQHPSMGKNVRVEDMLYLPRDALKQCETCQEAHATILREQEDLLVRHGPLRGLELYCGAGGLSTGIHLSGFVDTNANHPDAIVYSQCANKLLRHAVDTFEGKEPKALPSLIPKQTKPLPPMPRPGEVDFIFGGPPCQSFSRMNHNKREDDPRSTMVCNMLSYVEFYRPKYFLLENVNGLLLHPLRARQVGHRLVGGIKMGVVKFILRALISLGYQAHFKLLQAGQYGSPQSRSRVLFWGARRDVPLPLFPAPTHLFERRPHKYKLPTGDVLLPVTRARPALRSRTQEDHHHCAPLLPVTVEEAIGDLPRFDWINPHKVIKMTDKDRKVARLREAEGILRFDAVANRSLDAKHPGYHDPVPYLSAVPMNRYQHMMRRGADKTVRYQYTRRFGPLVVERTTSVPIEPGKNNTALPRALRMEDLVQPDGTIKRRPKSLFERIDGRGYFNTTLTTVNPAQKGGTVLHPTQKRILTVREVARVQGFPDSYEFLSVNKKPNTRIDDQYRQIGNAVPIPLGLALGKELGKALVKMWRATDAQAEDERAQSPEVPMDVGGGDEPQDEGEDDEGEEDEPEPREWSPEVPLDVGMDVDED